MIGVYKALKSDESAGKFKQQNTSKARQAKKDENTQLGIENRKSSPVKQKAGASRGGGLNKKLREHAMTGGDMMSGKVPDE